MAAFIKEFTLITLLIVASPALLVFHASSWAADADHGVQVEAQLEQ